MNILKLLIVILCLFISTISLAEEMPDDSILVRLSQGGINSLDLDMGRQLKLDTEQLKSYSSVMSVQRPLYLVAESQSWKHRQAVYRDTLDLLERVLDQRQLAQFSAMMDCLMKEELFDQQLVGL